MFYPTPFFTLLTFEATHVADGYHGRKVGAGARIIGTGSAVPSKVISNDDLSKIVDTSDEWIAARTGIRNRRIVSGEQN